MFKHYWNELRIVLVLLGIATLFALGGCVDRRDDGLSGVMNFAVVNAIKEQDQRR